MLGWTHAGFSTHDGVWLEHDDAAAHERLARYCARCPVSLERLEYDAETGTVTYTSDKADGPTAGRHTFEVTDFIARLVAHIPDKGQVLQRYYGYYANRARGERRKAARAPEAEPAAAEIDAATSRGPEPASPRRPLSSPRTSPASTRAAGPGRSGGSTRLTRSCARSRQARCGRSR